ncbi:GXWXG protein [Amphibacillus marinus]|uniref:GXWXG protein n=1 Tax=Amphibacillus marinus TaxID=872970 RepID=A0A1H8SL33_9BACI|nr:DUF4334 domain-containing protein [Amphibacillus marinus]SEO79500.1 GXWXG protein [Amphibacillus marinus]
MNHHEVLTRMLLEGATEQEAFAFFDQLEPIEVNAMFGLWRGKEIRTGHPLDGLLEGTGWFGKRFEDQEHVHPLVFARPDQTLYYLDPSFVPLELPIERIPERYFSLGVKLLELVASTTKSKARLRLLDYRGKASASMVYDTKPIIDVFRKIDQDTLLGVMDMKQTKHKQAYFFSLERVR